MEGLIWSLGHLFWLFVVALWLGGAWCLVWTVIRLPEILICVQARYAGTNIRRLILHWMMLLIAASLYFSITLFDVLLLSWALGAWTWAWLWIGSLYVLTLGWERFLRQVNRAARKRERVARLD